MSGFAASWLALRREADRRARDPGLAATLAAHLSGRERLTILDLGAGSGANMALTAPLLHGPQHWQLVDNDPTLLAGATPPPGVTAEPVPHDLGAGTAPLLAPRPDLVTASAFFDLAGQPWVQDLAAALAAQRLPLYATLIYDGRERWEPAHPLDGAALSAFHTDQRRDKGLGPALGPDAADALAHALRSHGFEVASAGSDWRLEAPRDAALIEALAGMSAAAIAPELGAAEADAWGTARRRASTVMIGHRDLLALPPRAQGDGGA